VATAQPASVVPPTNTPEPVSELIGREEELSEILNLVATHRLVTLTVISRGLQSEASPEPEP